MNCPLALDMCPLTNLTLLLVSVVVVMWFPAQKPGTLRTYSYALKRTFSICARVWNIMGKVLKWHPVGLIVFSLSSRRTLKLEIRTLTAGFLVLLEFWRLFDTRSSLDAQSGNQRYYCKTWCCCDGIFLGQETVWDLMWWTAQCSSKTVKDSQGKRQWLLVRKKENRRFFPFTINSPFPFLFCQLLY